jgi:hypothetical protein
MFLNDKPTKEDPLSKVENGGVVPFRHIKEGAQCHYGTEGARREGPAERPQEGGEVR